MADIRLVIYHKVVDLLIAPTPNSLDVVQGDNSKEYAYDVTQNARTISITTVAKVAPATLKAELAAALELPISEGDGVIFYNEEGDIEFRGFVFVRDYKHDGTLNITCYDALRYLQNPGYFKFKEKTATEIIKTVCDKFGLMVATGETVDIGNGVKASLFEDTKWKIPLLVNTNGQAIDVVNQALNNTATYTKVLYNLFVNGEGKVCLQNCNTTLHNQVIGDFSGATSYSFSFSIDRDVYNSVIFVQVSENEEETDKKDSSGKKIKEKVARGKYFQVNDSETIYKWGLLQTRVEINNTYPEDVVKEYLRDYINFYNVTNKEASISIGDTWPGIRAGHLVGMRFMDLGMLNTNWDKRDQYGNVIQVLDTWIAHIDSMTKTYSPSGNKMDMKTKFLEKYTKRDYGVYVNSMATEEARFIKDKK